MARRRSSLGGGGGLKAAVGQKFAGLGGAAAGGGAGVGLIGAVWDVKLLERDEEEYRRLEAEFLGEGEDGSGAV